MVGHVDVIVLLWHYVYQYAFKRSFYMNTQTNWWYFARNPGNLVAKILNFSQILKCCKIWPLQIHEITVSWNFQVYIKGSIIICTHLFFISLQVCWAKSWLRYPPTIWSEGPNKVLWYSVKICCLSPQTKCNMTSQRSSNESLSIGESGDPIRTKSSSSRLSTVSASSNSC